MLKHICAWCTKAMKTTPGEGKTHGICPECLAKELKELDRLEAEREVTK